MAGEQVRIGTVSVLSGQTIVRQVWEAGYSSTTSTFQFNEIVTWTGGGNGLFVSINTTTKRFKFVRTGGPDPVSGNVLTGGTSGATVTLAAITPSGAVSLSAPAGYNTVGGPNELAAGHLFFAQGNALVYTVVSTANKDNFTITPSFSGPDSHDVPYAVNRDFTTTWKLARAAVGDTLAQQTLRQLTDQLESALARTLSTEQAISLSAGTATVDWRISRGARITLTANMTSLVMTAPEGPCHLTLGIQQDGTGSRTIAGFPPAVKWDSGASGNPPAGQAISTGASTVTLYDFYWSGAVYNAVRTHVGQSVS